MTDHEDPGWLYRRRLDHIREQIMDMRDEILLNATVEEQRDWVNAQFLLVTERLHLIHQRLRPHGLASIEFRKADV